MDYLVLKEVSSGGQAADWEPIVIARGLEPEEHEAAATQGYTGPGRYKAIEWPAAEDSEIDLGPGPPVATPVSVPAPEEEEEEEEPEGEEE